MASNDGIDELKAKRLCYHCVGEQYLCDEVWRKGSRKQCSYCCRKARSYALEDFADRVETAFEQHYRLTSDQPTSWELSLLSDRESDYNWERHGAGGVGDRECRRDSRAGGPGYPEYT